VSEEGLKTRVKRLLVRIGRATGAGVLAYITSYVVPTYLLSQALEAFGGVAPAGLAPRDLLVLFATIVVFFTVSTEFTKGTAFEHAFSIGRGITLLFFFLYATGGGVISVVLTPEMGVPAPVAVTVDASRFLFILVGINLLDIGKSLIRAVYSMSERTEAELERGL